jgi:hypothetical protein
MTMISGVYSWQGVRASRGLGLRVRTPWDNQVDPEICTNSMRKFVEVPKVPLAVEFSAPIRRLDCLDPQPQKPSYAPDYDENA